MRILLIVLMLTLLGACSGSDDRISESASTSVSSSSNEDKGSVEGSTGVFKPAPCYDGSDTCEGIFDNDEIPPEEDWCITGYRACEGYDTPVTDYDFENQRPITKE